MTADFVARRGGGLLVLGARSFERAGLVGTRARGSAAGRSDRSARRRRADGGGSSPAANAVALTSDGVAHPATRLALTPDESRKRWSQLPPMASAAAAGAPRPGAQVLAVTSSGGADLQPADRDATLRRRALDGLCRRSDVAMAHDAALVDTTHELVWRQLTRWLAPGSAERIEIPPTAVVLPGTTEPVSVLVRDESSRPIGNAEVSMRVKRSKWPGAHAAGGAGRPARRALYRGRPLRSARRLYRSGRRAREARRRWARCRGRCWSADRTSSSASRG